MMQTLTHEQKIDKLNRYKKSFTYRFATWVRETYRTRNSQIRTKRRELKKEYDSEDFQSDVKHYSKVVVSHLIVIATIFFYLVILPVIILAIIASVTVGKAATDGTVQGLKNGTRPHTYNNRRYY